MPSPRKSQKLMNRSVTKSLLMAASIGMIVPLHAAPPRPSPEAGERENRRRLPKREDAEAVVPGTHARRADGTYIALSAEGGPFVMRFLDQDKRLTERPVPRALVRWNSVGRVGEDRCILNPGEDALTLVGNEHVRRPHNFKVNVTLLDADGKAVEVLVFDFKG